MKQYEKPALRRNEESLGEVMRRMLRAYGLEKKYQASRIVFLWEQVMGSIVARETLQISVEAGVLLVAVRSATLRQELFYMREQIRQRLNEEVGTQFIRSIRIV